MKIYELKPEQEKRKSFYGKATVIEAGKKTMLRSYQTIVCYFDKKGVFHRTWEGWSATTGRHIHEFALNTGNMPHGIGKAEWDKLPVEPVPNF